MTSCGLRTYTVEPDSSTSHALRWLGRPNLRRHGSQVGASLLCCASRRRRVRRHSLLGPPRRPATLRCRFGSFSSFRPFGCSPPERRPFRSQLAAHPRFRPASGGRRASESLLFPSCGGPLRRNRHRPRPSGSPLARRLDQANKRARGLPQAEAAQAIIVTICSFAARFV